MISARLFWGLLGLSLVLVAVFYVGMRKNLRLARMMAEILEAVLKPVDRTYTWLGGVIGFAAEYKVKGFEKVYANFRLFPRHSLLWMPFALLSGRRDTLQLLVFLKCRVGQEFHVVRKGILKPKIYNKDKLKKAEDGSLEFYYEHSLEMRDEVLPVVERLSPFLFHLAITPEKNVFYLECRGKLVNSSFEAALRDVICMIDQFQKKRSL
ncbi:MAG: hypothetical protein GXO44_05960 [Deferribacteres bacterium]|nr:hypothetical protein [Deferribacteres bacterium]